MSGYTKLFSSILASTIWRESNHVRIVWITLLAMSDKHGMAEGSLPGLADFARVSLEECKDAVDKLSQPDEYSRSKNNEGRRIAAVDGGWQILNHAKYRAKLNADERREYLRVKQQEGREKAKASTNVNNCSDSSTPSTHAEAAPAPEACRREGVGNPSLAEVLATAEMIGLSEWKARDWFDEMEGCGWLDFQHRPVVRWQSILNRVKVKWEADGRPSAPPSNVKLPGGAIRKLSVLDLKTVISAKEERCVALKGRHAAEGPLTTEWSSDAARVEFRELRGQIKDLKTQLSKMA